MKTGTSKKRKQKDYFKVDEYTRLYHDDMRLYDTVRYGKASDTIFARCSKYLGRDMNLITNFGRTGAYLYAAKATVEGYSVFFLKYSNLTKTEKANKHNRILDNGKVIEYERDPEKWKEERVYIGEIRVIFAYIEKEYVFYGVYNCTEIDTEKNIAHFERIDTYYPMKKDLPLYKRA